MGVFMYTAILLQGINSLSGEMCFIVCALFSFNSGLSVFALYFFLSCVCYKSLIISLMKAASIDGQPASMCDFFIDEQINDDDVIL